MQKTKAVFLDRDGTLNRQTQTFIIRPTQLFLLPGVTSAVARLNKAGFLVIIITNQAVVSRGIISPAGMKKLHKVFIQRLEKRGAHIDDVYFCPHHPDSKIKKWRKHCNCRKPEPGLLLQAIKKWNIDPKKSFMIGDALVDAVAGNRAGTKTIRVKTGSGHPRIDVLYAKKFKPDFESKDLTAAAKIVIKEARQ
jgi:D-glycero-D-manno-heptose 1,7-bisphosphate phosphatase